MASQNWKTKGKPQNIKASYFNSTLKKTFQTTVASRGVKRVRPAGVCRGVRFVIDQSVQMFLCGSEIKGWIGGAVLRR